MRGAFRLALPLIATCLAGAQATAGDLPDPVVEGTFIQGWRGDDGTHTAALRLRLAPGWKTYWRAPGDTGIPPQMTWDRTENVATVAIHWPVPDVFWVNDMRAIGYSGEVILPILVATERSGEDALLAGRVEIGVCEDICVPVTLSVDMMLPASVTRPDQRVAEALASRPSDAVQGGVVSVDCAVEPISDGMRLVASLRMPDTGAPEEVVVEYSDKSVWVSEPASTREAGTLRVEADLVPAQAKPFLLARRDLLFTVFGTSASVEILGCDAG